MNIFQFLFYLGIINIIFGFLWKWIFVLPMALLFTLLKFDYGMRLVKIFGSYLLVSLTALLTYAAFGSEPNILALIFYPIIAVFVLFMAYAGNQYEAMKEARASMDWEMMQRLQKDSGFEAILSIGSITLYILILFVPIIATNGLNQWLFEVIDWIYNIPIIGWLIGLGGVFFLINIIFHGFLAVTLIIANMTGKFMAGFSASRDSAEKCPHCQAEIIFEQEDLATGSAICPTCSRKIDLIQSKK